jgi:pilus assembly protein Flp/PilA
MTRVQNFLRNESGVTAIEYALIASLIAVFIIVAVQFVGTQVSTVFTEVSRDHAPPARRDGRFRRSGPADRFTRAIERGARHRGPRSAASCIAPSMETPNLAP